MGLVSGCFDILHVGHLELFEKAKKKVDILIVGLENDKSISLSKGTHRPISSQKHRVKMLTSLEVVDYVYPIRHTYNFDSYKVRVIHYSIYKSLSPDYLITNPYADSYWKIKEEQIRGSSTKLLLIKCKRIDSSTRIIDKLTSEL